MDVFKAKTPQNSSRSNRNATEALKTSFAWHTSPS